MKKQSRQYVLLAIIGFCLCWVLTPLMAQNQKIIFENPDGINSSSGSYIRPTADGGYIMLGMAYSLDAPVWSSLPRAIKVNAALQTEWDNIYLNADIGPNGLYAELNSGPLELNEGSFVFGISDTVTEYDLLRIAATGELLWGKDLPGVENLVYPLGALPNGDFLATRSHLSTYFTGWKHYVSRFNSNGDLLEEHQVEEVPGINASILLSGGDVLIEHDVQAARVFTRVDPQSNVVWQTAPLAGLTDVISPMPDGGFGVVSQINLSNFSVHFFDAQGNQTGQTPTLLLPISQILTLGFYPDGSFLVAGSTTWNKSFMARFQQDGAIVWSAEAPEDDQSPLQYLFGHPTADGWGIGTGGKYQNSSESKTGLFRVTEAEAIFAGVLTGKIGYDSDEDCTLAPTESGIAYAQISAINGIHNFHTFSGADGAYTLIVPPGNYTLVASVPNQNYVYCSSNWPGVSFPAGANGSATLDFPMVAGPVLHQVNGKLQLDQNNNCIADQGELVLKNWRVILFKENGVIQATSFTNVNGAYSFTAPEGNYTVVAVPLNQNFSICDPASQVVSVSGLTPQVVTADFVARTETNCSQMRVSIHSFPVRPCVPGSFSVTYRNDGAVPAENATVEVILPPGMTYLSATPAPAEVNGSTLTFELGQVLPSYGSSAWTGIVIHFEGSCDLQIGDELCIVASVTPEEFCGEAPEWNGAIMAIEGECDEDNNAVFTIKNIGNAPNSLPRHYIIVEDQIVLLQNEISLNPMTQQVLMPIMPTDDTSTIVMTVEQEPGFPGDDLVVFSLSNCAGTGGNPTGYGGSAGPFTTTKCVMVVNSYDPNDKNASPLGQGEAHSVRLGTPLEYTIRFQNTGNDTAHLVVIRDTLSHHFNTDRIEILGSSHAYEFAQLNENILHFEFKNILLPDSTANLEASQGFIFFRVYPKAGLAQGTVVENTAAIYFDYNEPIITNTVLRTYEDFTLVKTDEVRHPQALDVTIYPNPFSTQTTFELPEGAPAGDYALELYDAAGRRLRSMSFDGTRCMVMRNALPAGLLFWKISREGRMVASGKMIAE